MSSGLFAACISVSFHFCQVRDVPETKFYILDLLLISVFSKCVEAPTGITSSPLPRTQCFVISWEWVFSAPPQWVDLPQLLWSRKATLILSKDGFIRSYLVTDFPYHLTLCFHRHSDVYTQAIWPGSLGVTQWMRDARYQILTEPPGPLLGWFLGRSYVLSRIQGLLQGDSFASECCVLQHHLSLVWLSWGIRRRKGTSVFWDLVAILLLSECMVSYW